MEVSVKRHILIPVEENPVGIGRRNTIRGIIVIAAMPPWPLTTHTLQASEKAFNWALENV